MSNAKLIGSKIAEARKKQNISQAQLAQQLFISSQAVGKWERGESMPDITTFSRLAEILGVDLNYFSESFKSTAPENATEEPKAEVPVAEPLIEKQSEKPKWDMSMGNWIDADFSGLKNLNGKFSSSNIQRCLFIGSDLSGLLLKGNHVVGCDFSGSDLSSSRLQGSHLSGNKFNDCSLKEAEFSGCHIEGSDFSGADLAGATFKASTCQKNVMTNVALDRTSFIASELLDVVIDTDVKDCYFENCSFKRVTFQNSTLTNTFIKNVNLKRTKFINCQADRLTYEFLKNGKADLTNVTLIVD
ncbi:MAG: pentapeptide repeat-containing protein [Chloroflexota bacterium]